LDTVLPVEVRGKVSALAPHHRPIMYERICASKID
jgi:hypothetical protein